MLTAQVTARAGKYVTFQLSRQYFAIRSDKVRQILPASDVRKSAQLSAPFLFGSVAANGRLIPVIDIRDRLGLPARAARSSTCVIIVTPDGPASVPAVGIIADKLSEVVDFRSTEIRGSTGQLRIQGRPYGRPKTLLEPDELLERDEWVQLRSVLLT